METIRKEFDAQAIENTEIFAKAYEKLPTEKKAMVIAFMNGMEAQKLVGEENNAD